MKYYCLPIQSFKLCTVYNKSHVESTTGLHDSYTVSVMLAGARPSYSYNMAAACWTCHVAATTYSTFSRDRVSTVHLCLMPHSDHTAAKKKITGSPVNEPLASRGVTEYRIMCERSRVTADILTRRGRTSTGVTDDVNDGSVLLSVLLSPVSG